MPEVTRLAGVRIDHHTCVYEAPGHVGHPCKVTGPRVIRKRGLEAVLLDYRRGYKPNRTGDSLSQSTTKRAVAYRITESVLTSQHISERLQNSQWLSRQLLL